MFAKHLPPSAGVPRTWALDSRAADSLPAGSAVLSEPGAGPVDAIVGYAEADGLERYLQALRPGGRLILIAPGPDEPLLAALVAAGYIHCLTESVAEGVLYRGERPPEADSVGRIARLAGEAVTTPHVFVLVQQTPNKPVWRLEPGEALAWQAATVRVGDEVYLLAFSALVKAVAFMQSAIKAGWLSGVNKIGKYPRDAAQGWPHPLLCNPAFDDCRSQPLGPPLAVDPAGAITGEE